MLLDVLKTAAQSLVSGRARRSAGAPSAASTEYPLEVEQKLTRLHVRTPVSDHLDILFRDAHVGNEKFVDLFSNCLGRTGTVVTPFNVFQRFQTRLDLLHYFMATLPVRGARAECGVYRGATALLLAHAWRSHDATFNGRDLYLIDSFSGSSASVEQDLIPVRGNDGNSRREAFFPIGEIETTVDEVRGYFAEFPEVSLCAGWIPQVLATLPDRDWAFVHLDLTLYEPTLAALEYFYPRLTKGGVMLCDGSIFCPGAEKAWDEFCARNDLAYATLGHRETVLIK